MENDPRYLSYYERLGITENASVEEIEAAYRGLRKQFHPDTKPSAYRDYFDHSMKGINEAYDVLINPGKRRRYDLRLSKESKLGSQSRQEARQKDERKRQRKNTSQYPDPTHKNYEIGLTRLVRNVDGFKDALQAQLDLFANMRRVREDCLAELTALANSKEAKQDPQERLKIIESYEQTTQRINEIEESTRASNLSSFQEAKENTDSLLEILLYLEEHLSNLPTERRVELQATYDNLVRELQTLLEYRSQ